MKTRSCERSRCPGAEKYRSLIQGCRGSSILMLCQSNQARHRASKAVLRSKRGLQNRARRGLQMCSFIIQSLSRSSRTRSLRSRSRSGEWRVPVLLVRQILNHYWRHRALFLEFQAWQSSSESALGYKNKAWCFAFRFFVKRSNFWNASTPAFSKQSWNSRLNISQRNKNTLPHTPHTSHHKN